MMQICSIGLLALAPISTQEPNTDVATLSFLNAVQEGSQGGQVLDAATDVPVVTTATEQELQKMLGLYASAKKAGEAAEVIEALQSMELHDNLELLGPAIEALQYKGTKLDKAAVADEASILGISKRSKVAKMLIELESEVQAGGARVLASIPGKKSVSALMKTLKRKDVRKDRPLTMASVIVALGNLGHEGAAKIVESELKQSRHPLIARASIRYFGQIKTKDMGVVRLLISMLDAPEPASVDSASNPPASFWAARWDTWRQTRRDVVWSLRELTGKTWNPTDGEHASDSARAMKYVKENAKRLGLK